jgi:hypothetical protein
MVAHGTDKSVQGPAAACERNDGPGPRRNLNPGRRSSVLGRMRPPATSAWPTGTPSSTVDDVRVDVVTVTGRITAVEFRVRDDSVEIWHHDRLAASVHRTVLRSWLNRPERSLIVGEVMLNLDRSVDVRDRAAISLDDTHDRITVSVIDVRSWPLSDSQLARLRDQV